MPLFCLVQPVRRRNCLHRLRASLFLFVPLFVPDAHSRAAWRSRGPDYLSLRALPLAAGSSLSTQSLLPPCSSLVGCCCQQSMPLSEPSLQGDLPLLLNSPTRSPLSPINPPSISSSARPSSRLACRRVSFLPFDPFLLVSLVLRLVPLWRMEAVDGLVLRPSSPKLALPNPNTDSVSRGNFDRRRP